MSEITKDLNIIELLMGIKEDVSSIKTDMANFKEAQRLEKESTAKEILELKTVFKRDIESIEARIQNKINGIQTIQNNLVGDVDTLKHAEDKKDAKKWKTVIAYVCTSIGSMLLVKLPDIIIFLLNLGKLGEN